MTTLARLTLFAVTTLRCLELGAQTASDVNETDFELAHPHILFNNNDAIWQTPGDRQRSIWSIQIDNDSMVFADRDEDYSAGISFSVSGDSARNAWMSLDPALAWIDRTFFDVYNDPSSLPGFQFGLQVFTPDEIDAHESVDSDRPFASIVYFANSTRYFNAYNSVTDSMLLVGLLGTSAGEYVQKTVHEWMDIGEPSGYEQQISDGGELTTRYTRHRRALIAEGLGENTTTQIEAGYGFSLGYITEASIALGARWGSVATPWWSFTPNRGSYSTGLSTMSGSGAASSGEFFIFSGIKFSLRPYNALLQGQFRESEVTFAANELNYVIGDAWIGLTKTLFSSWRFTYSVHLQTAEIKNGPASRNPLWASVVVSRDY